MTIRELFLHSVFIFPILNLFGILLQFPVATGQESVADAALKTDVDWQPRSSVEARLRLQEMLSELGQAQAKDAPWSNDYPASWDESNDKVGLELSTLAALVPSFAETWAKLRLAPETSVADAFSSLPKPVVADVSLWIGRELARRRLYDESLKWLGGLEPMATCEPSAVLFYRAAAQHALWEAPDAARADLKRLLLRESEIPVRYRMTAKLMLADLPKDEEPNPLDEVSRIMNDVGRRLDLGRSGDPVVQRETQIIEKLDKMIDELEKKRQQQQQQQSAASGGNKNGAQSLPMQDSQAAGGSGPGDVDRRDLGAKRNWGDLPPAEREEALQKLSQQLPSHYREVIEGYFRKIASESAEK